MIRGTESTDQLIERPSGLAGLLRRKLLWGTLLAGLAIALVAYPSVERWASADRSVELSRLRLATVVYGDLERDIAIEGRIVAAFHPTLTSPAQGLVRLNVQAGEVVAAGALLATVSSPQLASRLEQERATAQSLTAAHERQALAATQANLRNAQQLELLAVRVEAAERAMSRAQRTHDAGLVNDIEYERARDELRLARLELEHAGRTAELDRERLAFEVRNSELAVERQQLVTTELERQVAELAIRAPFAGLVSRTDAGDHAAVIPGQSLVTIVDLSAFEVEVDIPESYADDVTLGTPAVIRVGDREYPGEVRSIAPEVAGSLVAGRVSFTGETPDDLRQNQRLGVRLVLASRPGVLKVERGPFLDSGGHLAYVVADGLATRRRITTGAVSAAEVEIVTGLRQGETIILSDIARFDDAETLYLRQ